MFLIMNMRIFIERTIGCLLCFIMLFSGVGISCAADTDSTHQVISSFTYLGAFRMPADAEWEWSGEAITFNPDGNGGLGSLIATGHNHRIQVSEFSIPEPVVASSVSALPEAATLQEFTNIYGDLYSDWYMEVPRVGLEVLNGQLYFCRGEHFQEEGNPETHGYASLDFSRPNPQGLWRIGDESDNYSTNNYMFKIPESWSDIYASGYDLATGRYRDGGWGGQGPSLHMVHSTDMNSDTSNIHGATLMKYTDVRDWDAAEVYQVDGYSEADTWTGGAWMDTGDAGVVAFCGNHGFGDSTWYGFANGVVYPIDEVGPFPEEPPYPYNERGWWNDDIRPALMLYDPYDLGQVAMGNREPESVQPFDIIDISDYMFNPLQDTTMRYLGGMAYDDVHQRLLIQELFADGDKPVIHVMGVEDVTVSPGSSGSSAIPDEALSDADETEDETYSVDAQTGDSQTVGTKNLIFIHHSVGENWLNSGDGGGGLTSELNAQGYAVSDIYYGWSDADAYGVTGDMTDTTDWPFWFNDSVMPYVYNETETMTAVNTLARADGENEIIMFKSCYPNSDVGSSISDEQAIYTDLLEYFHARQDKLFILVTPPPMIDIPVPSKTRELSNWLFDRERGWLGSYDGDNVYVFDFYNVLTHPSNHHMIQDGSEVHIIGSSSANELYYDSSGDDHPNGIGNTKATNEFVPLLNRWYDEWKGIDPDVSAIVDFSTASDWALDEILTARSLGLTTDRILNNFTSNITREEFCEIVVKLYEKLSGTVVPEVAYNPFTDTANTEILKAYDLGIVLGKGMGIFDPYSNITRQEMCVMLYRTLQAARPYDNYNVSHTMSFSDTHLIAHWAEREVRFINYHDIMKGVGNNRMNPLGNTPREQAIVLVKRTYEAFD